MRKTREEIIQDCINAITAEGARVAPGSNESWRAGVFHAADILRQLKDKD